MGAAGVVAGDGGHGGPEGGAGAVNKECADRGGEPGAVSGRQIASRVEFQRLNLMEPFGHVGRFHVIFCRNVMIYFDRPTQERLVGKFSLQLDPGGWLLIGHSEGLMGVRNELEYVMPAVYRKPG